MGQAPVRASVAPVRASTGSAGRAEVDAGGTKKPPGGGRGGGGGAGAAGAGYAARWARERGRSWASIYSATARAASLNSGWTGASSRLVGGARAYMGTS